MGASPPARVFVHCCRLTDEVERLPDVLSPGEVSRASAFRYDRDRVRYLSSHLLLRHQLGEHAGQDPAALVIRAGPYGKPELEGGLWHFNLSHSGDLYAAAFCEDHPVGIDVETARDRGDLLELVPQICHPREADALREEVDDDARRASLLWLWTGKEAFLKALGCGLQVAPARVCLAGRLRSKTAGVEADLPGDVAGRWKLHFLHVSPGRVLAVATAPEDTVELRESPFDA